MEFAILLSYFQWVALVCAILLNIVPTLRMRDIKLRKRYGRVTVEYVVGMLFGTYLVANLLPEIITAVESVNVSAWTFTGATGAGTIWQITGLLIVVGIVRKLVQ